MSDNPFPKSMSQIRRLLAQSREIFKDAKPSTAKERKSFNKIASKVLGRKVESTSTKPPRSQYEFGVHYQFCVDNDDSCICDQAKDGDKLYVAAPMKLTIDEGIDALADCMGIASVTYGDAGMKWIKSELRKILKGVAAGSKCPRCGFLDD